MPLCGLPDCICKRSYRCACARVPHGRRLNAKRSGLSEADRVATKSPHFPLSRPLLQSFPVSVARSLFLSPRVSYRSLFVNTRQLSVYILETLSFFPSLRERPPSTRLDRSISRFLVAGLFPPRKIREESRAAPRSLNSKLEKHSRLDTEQRN